MTSHDINGEIPKWLKMLMVFIDRVGFPILAFLLMFYVSYVSITRMTAILQDLTLKLTNTTEKAILDHEEIKKEIKRLNVPRHSY